ncbi:hypothetical protein DRO69_06640 [Candidatus Bathyarchaeota archaeon]|nr:MAG: hypothetical protein DRO69_06640 [Candidatus Bathyarchaeota archaeon]
MRKEISLLVAILALAIIVSPVFAWSYGDPSKPDDTKYETFGPRADQLLIKLYASDISEWESGIEGGEIDITDWPLDQEHYNRYTTPPLNETLKVMGYGAEFGIFLFDLNNNNNTYLGNPPNASYPNPVFPNPMADANLRKAIAYLVDRSYVISVVGEIFAVPLYTPVPPSMGKYSHPEIRPGGALESLCYLYNPTEAANILDTSGFPIDSESGWRYWDRNGNNVKDEGEDLVLKLFVRVDHEPRKLAGERLYAELQNVKIQVNLVEADVTAAKIQVMSDKDFHIYTGGWSLGVDPDHLILWNWDFYWHPGRPYNYAGCNDPTFNEASYGVMYANTQEEAVYYAHLAQESYAEQVLSIPLYTTSGSKVVSRKPVTPPYTDKYWRGFVNIEGYGVDTGFTFLNMRPTGVPRGGTIAYGFKTTDIRQLNPIYAEWLWDNTVIDLIGYESLVSRNPYDLGEFIPWLADSFKIGTYESEGDTFSTFNFTLRRDAYWSDGVKVTFEDINYTFLQMDDDLEARGLPPPWWISNVMDIVEMIKHSDQLFEVRMAVKSVFAIGWVGGNRILPKHIWEPICKGETAPKSGEAWDPTTFAPDPDMINSGPWRLDEYVPSSHILLVAHKPDTTVNTGLSDPNKDPEDITSPYGYFRYYRDEDLNKDDKVNILDAILLAGAFGAKEGDPKYSRTIDINGDGRINILDAILLSGVFGWPNQELAES